jgi:hypothetical protein
LSDREEDWEEDENGGQAIKNHSKEKKDSDRHQKENDPALGNGPDERAQDLRNLVRGEDP